MNNGNGDCFVKAGRIILDVKVGGSHSPDLQAALSTLGSPKIDEKDFRLVHAIVTGQGPVAGRKFSHGFVLWKRSIVIDYSNGNELVMPKSLYYKIGHIDEKLKGGYVEYSVSDAAKKMMLNKHWGPWDLDEALEEDFKGVGFKKIRLDRQALEMLR